MGGKFEVICTCCKKKLPELNDIQTFYFETYEIDQWINTFNRFHGTPILAVKTDI